MAKFTDGEEVVVVRGYHQEVIRLVGKTGKIKSCVCDTVPWELYFVVIGHRTIELWAEEIEGGAVDPAVPLTYSSEK